MVCHTHSSLIKAHVLEIISGIDPIEIRHQAVSNSGSPALAVYNNSDGQSPAARPHKRRLPYSK